MAKWIIMREASDDMTDEFNTLMDAEIALGKYEEHDKREGLYKENFYRIVYSGVRYENLSTTAKINCMSEFLGKVMPYGWDEVNDGEIADLEDTILYTIGSQFWFDEDGNWYDESMGML